MYVDEDRLPELSGRRCQRILLGCNGQGTTRFSSQRILIPSLNLRNVHTQKEALVIKFGYLVRERSFCMKLPGACRWTAGLLYSRLRYSVRILWLTASLGSSLMGLISEFLVVFGLTFRSLPLLRQQ